MKNDPNYLENIKNDPNYLENLKNDPDYYKNRNQSSANKLKNMTGIEFFNADSSVIDRKSINENQLDQFMSPDQGQSDFGVGQSSFEQNAGNKSMMTRKRSKKDMVIEMLRNDPTNLEAV